MELIRGLLNLKARHRGCAASIGNYDGVHLGHRHVLKELAVRARERTLPVTVVVFEPAPQEYFTAAAPPARLMSFCEKCRALAECGVDRIVCLRFDCMLAEMPADVFIERVLVRSLGVRYLMVGEDFRFGHDRTGDFAMLAGAGASHGFEVAAASTMSVAGQRVSSSRIRNLLAGGQLESAATLLGAPFSVSGRVLHGERLGHALGYPTANLPLKRRVSPVRGIFVAAVRGTGAPVRYGAAYVGNRPAVNGGTEMLEVNVFDFNGDLYGRRLRVELLHQLRADSGFESLPALQAQMARDVEAAHAWLKHKDVH
jgi:riboflavin kinase / FMN adenylyltransferase